MKFYWRLDTKCLTLYKSDTSSHYHREIALADMLAVDQMVNPELYPLTPPHVFEIVTSAMTYYVGVDMTGALSSDLKPAEPVDGESHLSSQSTIGVCEGRYYEGKVAQKERKTTSISAQCVLFA